VIGAEIGGAVKNVLAIACGVVDGLGLGQNARAALIARGYAEMLRFGLARGARGETLAGLCGLGDLVLTCSSTSSRNFSLGKALGEGQSAAEALAGKNSVAEGARPRRCWPILAAQAGIAMPIVEAVCRLLPARPRRAAWSPNCCRVPCAGRRSRSLDSGEAAARSAGRDDIAALAKGGRPTSSVSSCALPRGSRSCSSPARRLWRGSAGPLCLGW
jgi:hypothetical protein